jgi:hypothetical protein
MSFDWRNMTNVREGEFEVGDDGVYHVPSGAMFWAHPESTEPHRIDWGKAQDEDEDGGPLFDQGYIEYVARELLKARLVVEAGTAENRSGQHTMTEALIKALEAANEAYQTDAWQKKWPEADRKAMNVPEEKDPGRDR